LGGFFVRAFTVSQTGITAINMILAYLPLFCITLVAATPLGKKLWEKIREKQWAGYAAIGVAAVLMLLCVASLVSQSYNPFIYFRF
jgi:alginate O-acetyltransferase complex protein AlgI